MNEDVLRTLVREAVARHLASRTPDAPRREGLPSPPAHPSFHRYLLPQGSDGDGSCLIEPAVGCNHCGYCQSHGF